jgi:MoaA/NifB/PqqE/SkfB family radical SAM enzyme
MIEQITKPTISVMLTTYCTLKCKHCQIKIPYMEKSHIDKLIIKSAVLEMFKVIDFVDDLAVLGGEFMLHPDIDEILLNISTFNKQYKRLVLVTNGTLLPSDTLVAVLKEISGDYIIRIDDYGFLSTKVSEFVKLADSKKLKYEVRAYCGENCYGENGGGWVNIVGNFDKKDYTDDELKAVYENCHNGKTCIFLWGSKLYACGMHASGVILGKVPDRPGIDSIDLLSKETIAEKRKIVCKFGTFPPNACKYCNGFDINKSPRIQPAIQM